MTLHKMVRQDATDTSIEAAESIIPALPKLQAAVLAYAKMMGKHGFTDEQMNQYFNTYKSSYRARRAELVEKGLIEDSGIREIQANNRSMILWKIKNELR
jgi:hypothetical protein